MNHLIQRFAQILYNIINKPPSNGDKTTVAETSKKPARNKLSRLPAVLVGIGLVLVIIQQLTGGQPDLSTSGTTEHSSAVAQTDSSAPEEKQNTASSATLTLDEAKEILDQQGVDYTGGIEVTEDNGIRVTVSYDGQTVDYVDVYDRSGSRISSTTYNSDGTVDVVNEFDADGNMVRSAFYENNELDFYVISEFDSSGNEIREVFYNPDDSVDFSYTYEYDANGLRIQANSYDENGNLTSYYTNQYNSNGKRVRTTWYNETHQMTSYTIYEYNSSGNLVKSADYDASGVMTDLTTY